MSFAIVILVVCAILVALLIVFSVKQSQFKNSVNNIKASFAQLKSDSKAINESYLEETNEYLEYAAKDVKNINKIKTDLIGILNKYKENGKLSSDGFYDKAYKAIAG